MTKGQIVADICGRMNLVSAEAIARVGQAVDRSYRKVTATVGLEPVRYVSRAAQTQLDSDQVTFTGIEKIDRVYERGMDGLVRVLNPVPLAAIRESQELQGSRHGYAIYHQTATTITILLPGLALAVTDLYADGWSTLADMADGDVPAIPASFHDILINTVVAEEYLRKGNTELADRFYTLGEAQLRELRFHIADAPAIDWRQGDNVIPGAGGGGTGGAGSSVITGDIVFDRDPGPPFHVTAGSGLVDNLDADKLDGQHGVFYQDEANHTGVVPAARLGPHAAHHQVGGPPGDVLDVRALGGYPADPATFLRGDGTFAAVPPPAPAPPLAHAPTHQAGGSDPVKLDDLAAPDDNGDLNASTTAHGLLQKLPGFPQQFLNGQGGFTVPPTNLHANSHRVGQPDQLDVTNLAGFPGVTDLFLRADGTFAAPAGGGGGTGTPGGANTQIQFNDAGAFAGDAALTFNKTTKLLVAGGNIQINKATPRLNLRDANNPADQQIFQLVNNAGILTIHGVNDGETVASGHLSVNRAGDVEMTGKATVIGGTLALGVDPVDGAGAGGVIRRTTADGADNGYIILGGGGGAVDTGRGGRVVVFGNEAGAPGSIVLYPGNVPAATIGIKDSAGVDALTFRNSDKALILTRACATLAQTTWDGQLHCDLLKASAFQSPGTGNTFEVVFDNPPPAGVEYVFSLQFDVVSACSVTWPASVTWDEDVAPVFPGAGRTIILGFSTINGGIRWRGYIGGRNFLT